MFYFYKLKNFLKTRRGFCLTFSLILGFGGPVIATGFVFEKAVSEGQEDSSIKNLQIILNRDKRTQVAETGAGAPGAETAFFGTRTRGALARFQRLYDISGEYGFVGPKTRVALNKKLAELYFAETVTPKDKLIDQLSEAPKAFVFKLPSNIKGNSTYLADKKSPYTKRLEEAKKQESQKDQGIVGKPKIISLSPTQGAYGTTVTIRGENFTTTGNTIYTSYSVSKNVSSFDQKTLTFTIQTFGTEYRESRNLTTYFEPSSIPFSVYVENANGRSNSLIFNYQF